MEALEAELAHVYQTSTSLQLLLQEAKEQNKDFAASVIKKDEEIAHLRRDNEELRSLRHQMGVVQKQNDVLTQQNKILKEQLAIVNQQDTAVQQLTQDTEITKQQNTRLLNELKQSSMKIKQLEGELQHLHKSNENSSSASQEYEKILDQKTLELQSLASEKDHFYHTCMDYQNLLGAITHALEETNHELRQMQVKYHRQEKSYLQEKESWVKLESDLLEEAKIFRKQLDEVNLTNERLTDMLRERESDIQTLQQQNWREREKMSLWEKEHTTVLRMEYEKVKRNLEECKERCHTAEEEVKQMKRTLENDEVMRKSATSTAIQQQQQVWNAERSALVERINSLNYAIDILRRENEDYKHQASMLLESNSFATSAKFARNGEILAVNEKTDAALKNAETLKFAHSNSDHHENEMRLKSQLSESKRNEDLYRTKLAENARQIQQLADVAKEYELAYESLALKMTYLTDERDGLRRQVDDLLRGIARLEQECESLKEVLQKTKATTEKQKIQIAELQGSLQELDLEKTKLKMKIDKLKKERK